MSVKNRESENRSNTGREFETIGGFYTMDYGSPLKIHPGTIKDGYVAEFVRTSAGGDPYHSNYKFVYDRGGDPVPESRIPNRRSRSVSHNSRTGDEPYYSHKDVILFEIPKELNDRYRNFQQQEVDKQIEKVKHYYRDDVPPK
jgi:hypothetical protein